VKPQKVFILLWIGCLSIKACAQFTNATLEASGVTCSLCSKAIKKALEALPVVQAVRVDVKSQQYNIAFKKNSVVHFTDIQKAVEDAGFSIASLRVTGYFDNIKLRRDENVRIGDQTFDFLNADNETLNGERTFTLVDKNFLAPKTFKKYTTAIKQTAVSTTHVYHVII
jgi:copper chaperone CopZ